MSRPDDDAAWAGLALTGDDAALQYRPEVVAAVYRAVAAGRDPARPDPMAVAAWLNSGA
jgi:hypothetical protein